MLLPLVLACSSPETPAPAPETPAAGPTAAPEGGSPGTPTPPVVARATPGGGEPGTPVTSDLPPSTTPRPTGAAACALGEDPKHLAAAEQDVFAGWLDTMGKRYAARPMIQELTVEWVDRTPLDAAGLKAVAADADPAAYADARARSATVGSMLDLDKRVVGWSFLQEFERQQLFAGGGWAAFKTRYPQAGGLVSVTRAGFNPECTAVVFGYYVALGEGQGGSWLVWGKREGDGWMLGGETSRGGGLR